MFIIFFIIIFVFIVLVLKLFLWERIFFVKGLRNKIVKIEIIVKKVIFIFKLLNVKEINIVIVDVKVN